MEAGQFMMGGWWMFPIIMMFMCFVMMFLASTFFGENGGFPFMQGSMDENREPRNNQRENTESPLEILQKRYASGELNKAEYEEMRKTLQ